MHSSHQICGTVTTTTSVELSTKSVACFCFS